MTLHENLLSKTWEKDPHINCYALSIYLHMNIYIYLFYHHNMGKHPQIHYNLYLLIPSSSPHYPLPPTLNLFITEEVSGVV